MTLPNLRIVPRNFHDEAALTTQLAPRPGFPVTNTQSTKRDAAWRGAGIVNQYVRGVWPDDGRKLNFFGMFRHNWHGGTIQLQLYEQPDWTGLVYDSGHLETVSLITLGNFDWGTTPLGIVNDPFVGESPFWLYFSDVGAKAYQITFRDEHVQVRATDVEVGRFFLGKYFEVRLNTPSATLGFQDNTERSRSRGGSLNTNLGGFWRSLQVDLPTVFDSDRATWIDICRYAMTGRDVVISVLPNDADKRLERDYIINGKFASLDALGRTVPFLTKRIVVEEN
jgi:hypothetical protein